MALMTPDCAPARFGDDDFLGSAALDLAGAFGGDWLSEPVESQCALVDADGSMMDEKSTRKQVHERTAAGAPPLTGRDQRDDARVDETGLRHLFGPATLPAGGPPASVAVPIRAFLFTLQAFPRSSGRAGSSSPSACRSPGRRCATKEMACS